MMVGRRFGAYEVLDRLGEGGMGQVWRARDTKLDRDVAIKILPEAFVHDADRVARFTREAKTLAALNHPHIAGIYGLEESAGVTALVMELVEGEDLSQRIARGPIPIEEALPIARQIAEALEAAHEQGIIHRDLKPANIKVRADGTVKVLDFGLAKALDQNPSGAAADHSPTITSPAMTAAGIILGTAAYMSPEQARGRPVDRRADIWAFGCVLFEMLTGRRPFDGSDVSEVMARVIERDPDWAALPGATPAAVGRLLRRCLLKDPRRRLAAIADARLELDDAEQELERGDAGDARAAGQRRSWSRWATVAALLSVGAAVAVVGLTWVRERPEPDLLAGATFTSITNFEGDEFDASISPDGAFVTFVGEGEEVFDVWLSQVDTGALSNLTRGRLGDVLGPPEVRTVGFSAGGKEVWLGGSPTRRMRLLPLMGGPPRNVLGPSVINADWTSDGARVVYHTREAGDPVYVADANGANDRQILGSQAGQHQHYPVWSADEEWIYLVRGRPAVREMALWRVRPSGEGLEQLTYDKLDVRYPTPVDDVMVLFVAQEQNGAGPWLWAYDVQRRRSTRIVRGVEQYTSVSASSNGQLLAVSVANPEAHLWSVPILDRVANESDVEQYPVPSARSLAPRFRFDTLFYLSSRGAGDGLWRLDGDDAFPVWNGSGAGLLAPAAISPDGSKVAVVPRRQSRLAIEIVSADGAEGLALLDKIDVRGAPSWSSDGRSVLTGGIDSQGQGLFRIPIDGGAPEVIVRGEALNPVPAPGTDLIAYVGQQVEASAPLLAVRSDGLPVEWPNIRIRRGGQRFRFLPTGKGLVYMQGGPSALDFHLLELESLTSRQLTALEPGATIETFDVTGDGTHIVFDRHRRHSNIVLIERDTGSGR